MDSLCTVVPTGNTKPSVAAICNDLSGSSVEPNLTLSVVFKHPANAVFPPTSKVLSITAVPSTFKLASISTDCLKRDVVLTSRFDSTQRKDFEVVEPSTTRLLSMHTLPVNNPTPFIVSPAKVGSAPVCIF